MPKSWRLWLERQLHVVIQEFGGYCTLEIAKQQERRNTAVRRHEELRRRVQVMGEPYGLFLAQLISVNSESVRRPEVSVDDQLCPGADNLWTMATVFETSEGKIYAWIFKYLRARPVPSSA